jgi:Family of unknown function (DUF6077)
MAASRVRATLDFLSDLAVVGFATWTLVAYLGMLTTAPVRVLVPLWLVLFVLAAVLMVRLKDSRRAEAGEDAPGSGPVGFVVLGLCAGGLFALLTFRAEIVPWSVVWALAACAVVAAFASRRFRISRNEIVEAPLRAIEDAVVAVVALGFAAMSLFISDSNEDDVFYVNRATATAQLGHIPTRDVIFTDEAAKRLGGTGLPLDAYSALQGALGNVLGIHGASVAYYVFPPVFTFLATWALWRLLRLWSPRWPLVAFGVGCVFLLWSAQVPLSPGSFFLGRIWQGKVAFVAWLVPTLYVLATRWLGRHESRTGFLLVAAGVASVGLTGSAALVVPLIVAATAPAVIAGRDWSAVPVLAAVGAFPLAVVFGVSQRFPLGHRFPFPGLPTEWYYHAVFGSGAVAIVAAAGLWLAPWLARRGPPAALATGIAVVAAVLLAPDVVRVLNDTSGLAGSRALRRTLWVVPLPAVVGLLSNLPYAAGRLAVRRVPQWAAPAAAGAVLTVLLITFGHPLWLSANGGTRWVARPQWKTSPYYLRTARAILARYEGKGPVLAELRTMKAITLLTVEPKAVNPRSVYARQTDEPPARIEERLALKRFVLGQRPKPSPDDLAKALADLRVGLVCVPEEKTDLEVAVEQAGNYREAFRTKGQVCLSGGPGMSQ